VTLAYHVKPESREEFRRLMKALRGSRRRDGAYYWQLFRDTEHPDWYLETFLVESWLEHLRQHERVTNHDRALQERVQTCLLDAAEPRVSHWVAETG
jgi:quinol monooxygenase YgiN